MHRVLAVLLVLAAALAGLVMAAALRVGAFDCPGIVPLVEDGVVVGETTALSRQRPGGASSWALA
jgi:hypothetical protein